jgi:hypothetical protein
VRRLLIVVAGAAAGVAGVLVGRLVLDRYAAEGGLPTPLSAARADVAAVLGDLGGVIADVREGAARREEELRLALGLDQPPPGVGLDPQATKALLDDPVGWRARQG